MKRICLTLIVLCFSILTSCSKPHYGLAPYEDDTNKAAFSLQVLGSLVEEWATIPSRKKRLEEKCYKVRQHLLSKLSLPLIITDANIYNALVKTREIQKKNLKLCEEDWGLKEKEAKKATLNYIPEYNIWFVVEAIGIKLAVAKVPGYECMTTKLGVRQSMTADILVTNQYSEETSPRLPYFSEIVKTSQGCVNDLH